MAPPRVKPRESPFFFSFLRVGMIGVGAGVGGGVGGAGTGVGGIPVGHAGVGGAGHALQSLNA